MGPSNRGPRGRTHTSRRREPSEGIEEDELTQAAAADSDEDDEIEALPPTKAPKLSKSKRAKPSTSAAAALDTDMLAELGDQPIDRGAAGKLSGMSDDWKRMRETIHANAYALIRDIAATMAEFGEDDAGQKTLGKLDSTMRSLVDTENELLSHEKALHDLHQKIARGEPVTDAITLYDEGVQRQKQEYAMRTSRKKYANNDEYLAFRQAIYEVQHPGQPMPPASEFIEQEEGDDSDDDDDVVIGGVTQDYKCPLSLTILVDPLTSKTCGHSFSAEAIREYLGSNRTSRKKCPTSGCNKVISLDDLKPDKELAKKAREAARRERMREEHDEDMDEEIIE
ncbi:zinc-finger of the MIZ type in Nse subunit-domain-containing protein [Cytidiella melzeri]|nr:zinc-finger of the MIZ type in Nse subunit-domain-containing protein [Cytidiella melzeri]